MNASSSPPGNNGAAADPSMEDILASIRRILSEDEAEAAHSATAQEEAPVSNVLTLDASMLVEDAPPEPSPPPLIAVPSLPVALPPPPPRAPALETMPVSETSHAVPDSLLGAAATAAASSSVGSLLRTLVTERQQIGVHRGGPTIEDMVREEVRPLLKEWLDSNLPTLVERLVRAEIERLVGRALS